MKIWPTHEPFMKVSLVNGISCGKDRKMRENILGEWQFFDLSTVCSEAGATRCCWLCLSEEKLMVSEARMRENQVEPPAPAHCHADLTCRDVVKVRQALRMQPCVQVWGLHKSRTWKDISSPSAFFPGENRTWDIPHPLGVLTFFSCFNHRTLQPS